MRWFLASFFGLGYLATYSSFPEYSVEYFLLCLTAAVACQLLLLRLGRSVVEAFPVWILLGVFCVGYYLQFFLLAWDPDLSTGQIVIGADRTERILMGLFTTMGLAFCAFCMTAYWALGGHRPPQLPHPGRDSASEPMPPRRARIICSALLMGVVFLEVILGYASWAASITVMGAENTYLPYRMAGLIFYTRTVALLAFLLLLVWLTDTYGFKNHFRLAVLLLLGHGIVDAVLRSSRSSLVFTFLALLFLVFLTGRSSPRRLRFLAVGLVAAVLSFPVITVYRYARGPSDLRDVVHPLAEGITSTYLSENFGAIVTETVATLVFRVTGTNSLLEMIASGARPIGLGAAGRATAVFNDRVMNVANDSAMAYAPSLVGWFYFVGGNALVLVGIPVSVVSVQRLWHTLSVSDLRTAPISQVLFLVLVLYVGTDGVLEALFWWVLVAVCSIVGAEMLLKASSGQRSALLALPDSRS